MTPLAALLRNPAQFKHQYLSFGGSGGYSDEPFWLNEDRRSLLANWSPVGHHEDIGVSFENYVDQAYKANGIVFTCCMVRQFGLSEARFMFQRFDDNGRPGDLFDDPRLTPLHRPAPNMTTGELISHLDQDASLAGNAYWTPVGDRMRRMRPDWVTIVTGVRGDPEASPFELDAEVLGYIYHPKVHVGPRRRPDPVFLTPDRVVHYSPIPDPLAQWRGMSWLTPVLREIDGDNAAMRHKLKFFTNGTTSNLALTYDASVTPDAFAEYVRLFEEHHTGVDRAYKALHLGGGVDPKMLGADMKQLDFKVVQGHGESRIAAASGVGAVVAQFSEGLQGSSLNAGNFKVAMRRSADLLFRPLWRIMAASLETVARPPERSRLWYDDRDVEFLKDDARDAADIDHVLAQAIRTLTDSGYDGSSAVAAIAPHWSGTLKHTGLPSVQVQPREPAGD